MTIPSKYEDKEFPDVFGGLCEVVPPLDVLDVPLETAYCIKKKADGDVPESYLSMVSFSPFGVQMLWKETSYITSPEDVSTMSIFTDKRLADEVCKLLDYILDMELGIGGVQ